MAMQVNKPQRQDSMGSLQKAVGVANLVTGITSGDPLKIAGGAASVAPKQKQTTEAYNPMQTRLASSQTDTNQKLETLRNAEIYLNSAPPEIRLQYGPALMETMIAASRQMKEQGRIG